MIGFIIVVIIILLLGLIRPFTVIVHELGHAIPALLFSKERVNVYIGSYNEPNQNFSFSIGRLYFFFKYSPFLWEVGLCSYTTKRLNFFRELIITLCGPLISLLIGLVAFYFAIHYDIHGILKVLGFVVMLSAIFDFYANLYPNKCPIRFGDGKIGYNDGESLMRLIRFRPYMIAFYQAEDFFIKEEYNTASEIYRDLIKKGVGEPLVFRQAIQTLLLLKEYKEICKIQETFEKRCELSNEDYSMMGIVYRKLEDFENALNYDRKSLAVKARDYIALNNLGYTYLLIEQFEESIPFFDKAIIEKPSFAFSYNNRGLAKIKTGQLEEGLKDIKESLKLDSENAYAWRNLGIYFLEKKDLKTAYEHLQKAESIENDIPLLQSLLVKAKPQ